MDTNQTDNQEFICLNCGHVVKPLKMGIRNHCPKCLYSLHLDIFPNDNANDCHGLMAPVHTLQNEDGELLIVHKCLNCGKSARAKVALDDDYDIVLKIIKTENDEESNDQEQ